MAQNKADLVALINSNLPDNTTGLITPQKHREVATQTADSALNTVETAPQTVASLTNFTNGIQKGGTPVAIGCKEVEVLRAFSTALVQEPTALNTAKKVEFGADQKTLSDPVMIDALGNVTFNQSGTYAVRVKLQAGRTGASGISILFSRILKNGVQIGVSAGAKMASSDFSYPAESKVTLQDIIAGDVFTVEIMRDSAGSNFGGIYGATSSAGWNISPCALLVVSRFEAIT